MSVKSEVVTYNLLSESNDITNIVGNAIFPNAVPENRLNDPDLVPFILFRKTTEEKARGLGQPPIAESTTIRLDYWAADYEQLKDLSEAIETTFDGVKGTIANINVMGVFHSDEEEVVESQEEYTQFHEQASYNFWIES